MPWVKIPPENLSHLTLFGYSLIADDGEFVWYHGPKGRIRVEKASPCIFVEDDAEAMQLGAIAMLRTRGDNPPGD